jgi:Na+(H+)/acetate symporter ActP
MREDQQVQKKDNEETSKIIIFPKINKRVLDSVGSTVQELEEKVISNKIKKTMIQFIIYVLTLVNGKNGFPMTLTT